MANRQRTEGNAAEVNFLMAKNIQKLDNAFSAKTIDEKSAIVAEINHIQKEVNEEKKAIDGIEAFYDKQ